MQMVISFSSFASRTGRLVSGIFAASLLAGVFCAVPAAKAQSVFVAEYYNERISKYDASGTNQGLFASLPPSGARFYGAAVDSTGAFMWLQMAAAGASKASTVLQRTAHFLAVSV